MRAQNSDPPSKLTLTLDADIITVSSLAEARSKVANFVREHGVTAADYGDTTGRIERDRTPYARVSFHGRLWMLDEQGRECYREMDDSGRVAP